MRAITWLHLSDLHFRVSGAYNMDVVLRAFLRDVPQLLAADALQPDFVAITGDIAFSGQAEEYELALHFVTELKARLGQLPTERLFVVPGNHDVNRKAISPLASAAVASLDNRDKVNELLGHKESVSAVLKKFDNYAAFMQSQLQGHLLPNEGELFFLRTFELADRRIAIMGLNSAWARLIRNFPAPKDQQIHWRQLLEAILSQPRKYAQTILAATMQRYEALAGQIGPDISVGEASLGLPAVK